MFPFTKNQLCRQKPLSVTKWIALPSVPSTSLDLCCTGAWVSGQLHLQDQSIGESCPFIKHDIPRTPAPRWANIKLIQNHKRIWVKESDCRLWLQILKPKAIHWFSFFFFLEIDRNVILNVSDCWTNRIVIHSMAALRHISNNKFIDFLTLRNLWDL